MFGWGAALALHSSMKLYQSVFGILYSAPVVWSGGSPTLWMKKKNRPTIPRTMGHTVQYLVPGIPYHSVPEYKERFLD